MPRVSVVIPVYNVEAYLAAALDSVLAQTYRDCEVLLVDDNSPDGSLAIGERYQKQDARIQILRQENRGLAGARNTGVRHAQGEYIAFLDSDDVWAPTKLAKHVAHLDQNPTVGISFSRSAFIDQAGAPLNYYQMPKLQDIDAAHLLCRNPVGNGSAPVLRREALAAIAYPDDLRGSTELFYFDERLRQSEDIECWLRVSILTPWKLAGIPEALTFYRVNTGGLSAGLQKQLASWEYVLAKVKTLAPDLVARSGTLAKAYQLRYLARRAVQLRDGTMAVTLFHRALGTNLNILVQEPRRTLLTWAAAYALVLLPKSWFAQLETLGMQRVSQSQERLIMTQEQGR
jgi:glycosyltransferase involved in cell wall biosynthesis